MLPVQGSRFPGLGFEGSARLFCILNAFTRLPSNLGLKRVPFFAKNGFIREPKPPKKGTRVLLGILVHLLVWLMPGTGLRVQTLIASGGLKGQDPRFKCAETKQASGLETTCRLVKVPCVSMWSSCRSSGWDEGQRQARGAFSPEKPKQP